jgi:hypothetical protein
MRLLAGVDGANVELSVPSRAGSLGLEQRRHNNGVLLPPAVH